MAGHSSTWVMISYDRETMVEELRHRLQLEGIVPERLTVIRTATEPTVRDWLGEGEVSSGVAGTGPGLSWRARFQAVPVAWGPAILVGLWLVGSLTGVFPTRSVGESLGIVLLLGLAAFLIRATWRHFRVTPQRSTNGRIGTSPGQSGERRTGNGRVIVAMRLEGARLPELEKIVQATGGKPMTPVNPINLP